MNRNEVFQKVKNHLLAQGEKAATRDGTCYYRAGYYRDRKCAIGCLISDEAYSVDLEGKTIDHDMVLEALEHSGVDAKEVGIDFLNNLQLIHDTYNPSKWEYLLRDLAAKFNLDF